MAFLFGFFYIPIGILFAITVVKFKLDFNYGTPELLYTREKRFDLFVWSILWPLGVGLMCGQYGSRYVYAKFENFMEQYY